MANIEKYMEGIIPGIEENNESPLCKDCGRCCSRMGCHLSPKDVKDKTVEGLIKLIEESECIGTDWWEGDLNGMNDYSKIYYLRAKHKDEPVVFGSYGGTCVLLTETGCMLPFEYRPRGARLLIPCAEECIVEYSKYDAVEEWREYQDVLQKVVEHFDLPAESNFDAIMKLLGCGYN